MTDIDATAEEQIAAILAPKPPVEPTAEQQLAAARLRALATEHALLHGVSPPYVRLVARDLEEAFELRDGTLQPRDGQRDPGDPLMPLAPALWLAEFAKTHAALFTHDQRAQ